MQETSIDALGDSGPPPAPSSRMQPRLRTFAEINKASGPGNAQDYAASLRPFLSIKEGPVMGPHPLSLKRQSNQYLLEPETIKSLESTMEGHRRGAHWFPNSNCCTFKPLTTMTNGKEHKSATSLLNERKKQVRSSKDPNVKFDKVRLESQEIGWKIKTAKVEGPPHGLRTSHVTRFYDNMLLTKSHHIMRGAR
ncbi:unnamed protein product [Vitrella brassicaformis CCMP3155]|uniref:Uncharacterized protein n=1 Tax=Vitrella brassicaformis (strain CCMP3155) TaxID=1169540 RepID=A0A0G4GB37_VITBC|nr:unnamed protein product [Vitrella brassicaformis CCMP3155]|mmetsp:Transcript_38961/g.97479  ORF Transcript_38961/g.97479 Transcript_38961/m.97479 type:complete len:194 (-) Transcript_38961:113-694(-)|eukprot:CEM25866.1 unnamed protein product [Vitrella brassicaformis CCMP3155]